MPHPSPSLVQEFPEQFVSTIPPVVGRQTGQHPSACKTRHKIQIDVQSTQTGWARQAKRWSCKIMRRWQTAEKDEREGCAPTPSAPPSPFPSPCPSRQKTRAVQSHCFCMPDCGPFTPKHQSRRTKTPALAHAHDSMQSTAVLYKLSTGRNATINFNFASTLTPDQPTPCRGECSFAMLPHPIPSYPILSCPILSCPILSYPIPSCPSLPTNTINPWKKRPMPPRPQLPLSLPSPREKLAPPPPPPSPGLVLPPGNESEMWPSAPSPGPGPTTLRQSWATRLGGDFPLHKASCGRRKFASREMVELSQ